MAAQIDAGGGKKKVRPEMNITPLIDVVLVLLIIFMVVTPLMIKQLWVNTPKPVQSDSAQPEDPETPAVVAVDAQGKVKLNHEAVEPAALPGALRASLRGKKDKTVFFSAHDDAPYGAAVDVMDIARGAGASSIAVATQKAEPAPLEWSSTPPQPWPFPWRKQGVCEAPLAASSPPFVRSAYPLSSPPHPSTADRPPGLRRVTLPARAAPAITNN